MTCPLGFDSFRTRFFFISISFFFVGLLEKVREHRDFVKRTLQERLKKKKVVGREVWLLPKEGDLYLKQFGLVWFGLVLCWSTSI